MTAPPERLYQDLAAVLRGAFPDREYSGETGPDTRVFADLGLASIEVVVLAERLEVYFGRKLPFGLFLADLRARGADDIRLAELVAFLGKYVG